MAEIIDHEVKFEEYCKRCKHDKTPAYDEPCDTCLEFPFMPNSRKPLSFEEVEKSN